MPAAPDDDLAREARAPLETFATMVRHELATVSPVAGEIVAGGLMGADTFQPTLDTLRRLDVAGSATVLAVGKAAGPMALAWTAAGGAPGDVVLGRDAHLPPSLWNWTVHRAEHPVPGPGSYAAGRAALQLAAKADHLVLLVSGGASALMDAPASGDEDDHAELCRDLWAAGLPLDALNAARGLTSRTKAGGLAAASADHGGAVTVLVASDAPGDHVELVGSGPAAALDHDSLVARLGPLPDDLRARVEAQARDPVPPVADVEHHLVVGRRRVADAAAGAAAHQGLEPVVPEPLDSSVEEAAEAIARHGAGLHDDAALILWGEPLVAVGGATGVGGRTTHLALATAALEATPDAALALAATDGQDGPHDIGGAHVALGGGVDREAAARHLAAFSSAEFLRGLPIGLGGVVPAHVTGANAADVGVVVPSAN